MNLLNFAQSIGVIRMNDHTQQIIDINTLIGELNSLATLGFIPVDKEVFGTELERQHLMATLCLAAKVIEDQQEIIRTMKTGAV
jgi:CO dehydrogenase nickel-insertion accessory protein CooC1